MSLVSSGSNLEFELIVPKTHSFHEKINFPVSDLATYCAMTEFFLIILTIACGVEPHLDLKLKRFELLSNWDKKVFEFRTPPWLSFERLSGRDKVDSYKNCILRRAAYDFPEL